MAVGSENQALIDELKGGSVGLPELIGRRRDQPGNGMRRKSVAGKLARTAAARHRGRLR